MRPLAGIKSRAVGLTTAVVVVTVVSIAVRQNSPAYLGASWTFDDALYTKLAWSLLEGKWLGPYDFLTLSKGPGFPLFIAAAYELHLPLKLAEHLVHLLAAGTIAFALTRMTRNATLGVAVYAVVALNPGYLGQWASGITRDGFYSSLSLLLVGSTLLVVTFVPALVRRGWLAVPLVLAAGCALGLVTGAYYMTRDERAWLAPAVLAAGVAGTASWRREGPVRLWHAGVCLAIVVAAAGSFTWSVDWVASRNDTAYGTRVISDLAEGEIAHAYEEWQRVDAGRPVPLVPVNEEQREAVYDVSPAAAELEAHLKGGGTRWMGPDCAPPTPDSCEYTGGFFVWAIREAAQVTGHMSSGGEAQRFFGQMADEIAAACDTRLECTDPGIASMPPLERIDEGRILPSFWTATDYLLDFGVAEPPWERQSIGTPEQWDLMTRPLRTIDGDRAEYNSYERRAANRQQVVAALADVYRWAARWGTWPALLGLALVVTRAGRRRSTAVAAGALMLVAVLSRLVLLALVNATAFLAANYGTYILPGVDFLLVLLVVGWWLLVGVCADAIRGRRREQTPGDDAEAGDPPDEAAADDVADARRRVAPRERTPSLLSFEIT